MKRDETAHTAEPWPVRGTPTMSGVDAQAIRLALGISIVQLAKTLCVSVRLIVCYECGYEPVPAEVARYLLNTPYPERREMPCTARNSAGR